MSSGPASKRYPLIDVTVSEWHNNGTDGLYRDYHRNTSGIFETVTPRHERLSWAVINRRRSSAAWNRQDRGAGSPATFGS